MSYDWNIGNISPTLETRTIRETLKSRVCHTHSFCRKLYRENVQRNSKQTFWSIPNTNNSPHRLRHSWNYGHGTVCLWSVRHPSTWSNASKSHIKEYQRRTSRCWCYIFFSDGRHLNMNFYLYRTEILSMGSRRLTENFIHLATEKVSQTELVPR